MGQLPPRHLTALRRTKDIDYEHEQHVMIQHSRNDAHHTTRPTRDNRDWRCYIDTGNFAVREGEPSLTTTNTNKYQSTAKVIFSPKGKINISDKLQEMSRLLEALVDMGLEAFWSCGKGTDRRCNGDFVFSKMAQAQDKIQEQAASAWIRSTCLELGHLVLRDWGNFKWTKGMGYEHERHVKFLHPASFQVLNADDTSFTYNNTSLRETKGAKPQSEEKPSPRLKHNAKSTRPPRLLELLDGKLEEICSKPQQGHPQTTVFLLVS